MSLPLRYGQWPRWGQPTSQRYYPTNDAAYSHRVNRVVANQLGHEFLAIAEQHRPVLRKGRCTAARRFDEEGVPVASGIVVVTSIWEGLFVLRPQPRTLVP